MFKKRTVLSRLSRLPFFGWAVVVGSAVAASNCSDDPTRPTTEPPLEVLDPVLVEQGRSIFRFDDFGSSQFWTDTLRLNDLVEGVDPLTALSLGLKVDADAVPAEVLAAVLADPAALSDPATTRALLSLDAVVGLSADVEGDQITRMGITCALCHATVDDRVSAGIGSRLDGYPNRDLAVGTIISLTPGLPDGAEAVYSSWPAGYFDPRFDVDGISAPILIPPAYGLAGVEVETYTGEGPVSYWNNYVAVMEMHGRGSFVDERLGIAVTVPAAEDRVADMLEPLRQYQLSLTGPPPPAGSWDAIAAERGRAVFEGPARCASCHVGERFTDGSRLHAPSETGMDGLYAQRSTTKAYRTTPLRSLWQHPPYFHDGSAGTLAEVVDHYDTVLSLGLSPSQKTDLVEYLRSL